MPDFNAQSSTSEREEVFLIKWSVRSYLHYSLERRTDMDKFDPAGTTSKIKVKRYVQDQEALFGLKWKSIVDKQRTEIHRKIHTHGLHAWDETIEDGHDPTKEEDFFLSDYM